MCTICSECVADVYVGVETHLCNIHTRPCTSAQNTCKVHVTLTAKKTLEAPFDTVLRSLSQQTTNLCNAILNGH